ncbi:MAG: aspartate-semialdehyde dehydrogenase [Promethearchaeota archaeon]
MSPNKLNVGILGATGIVGQNYIKLLIDHPWFQVKDLAASPRSAGKTYSEAVKGRWHMDCQIPEDIGEIMVRDVNDFDSINEDISFYFSAITLPNKDDVKKIEFMYAKNDFPIISNNSAHRWTPDVPMIMPEVNPHHLNIIPVQKKLRGFKNGFVIVKPNCSIQSYVTPIFALEESGYKVDQVIVTTLQAVSGAGHPGVSSLDIIDNIIPFIKGEEEKSEREPLKVLGQVGEEGIILNDSIKFSATCTRVPVIDGHTASVNLKFKKSVPNMEEVIEIWQNFKSLPQELKLPFAPEKPIIYLQDEDRPQPRMDRDNDKGMAITIGRLRKDNVFDYKFVALSHNTIRGAAGGAILSAELLKVSGYLK